MDARVLLVEDDPRILSFLQRGLQAEGYEVQIARDGRQGHDRAAEGGFDVVILDRMLPGMEGLEVCRKLREGGCRSLILMLTARDDLQDKIDGLKGGADDYLTKPFALDELLARLEALLRRHGASEGRGEVDAGFSMSSSASAILQVADLRLDFATKRLWRGDQRIELTAREFALLAYLMANAGTVVNRAKLLSSVWGLSFDPGTKIVDVYVRYVRRKIGDGEAGRPTLLRTVRGFGYTLSEPVPDEADPIARKPPGYSGP